MTLPTAGPISLGQITSEFGLPANSLFPNAFYGKGGAPSSGSLSFGNFYGRGVGGAAPALGLTLSPASLTRATPNASLTANCVANPTGGTAPYSYAWSKVSGGAIVLTSTNTQTTTVSAAALGPAETRTAVFQCIVTDAAAATKTATLNVSFSRGASS